MPAQSQIESAIDLDCQDAASFLRSRLPGVPRAGVILGSGLGGFVDCLTPTFSIPFREIPGLPVSTAMGHAGVLHCADMNGSLVLILQGRCHLYEGHSRWTATRAVRALCGLGVQELVVSCAAGGLNPDYRVGDIMLLDDHLDLLGADHQLERPRLAPPPKSRESLYPIETVRRAEQAALDEGLILRRGTYVAVRGPNYETRAELRFLRAIGADAVGMSSIPEVCAARHRGVTVFGLATITNECRPDNPHKASGSEVLEAAAQAEPQFRKLVLRLLDRK